MTPTYPLRMFPEESHSILLEQLKNPTSKISLLLKFPLAHPPVRDVWPSPKSKHVSLLWDPTAS